MNARQLVARVSRVGRIGMTPGTAVPISATTVDANTITVTFNRSVTVLTTGGWLDFQNGAPETPAGISVSGAVVTLTTGFTFVNGDVITVSYAGFSAGNLKDSKGQPALPFGSFPVTNTIP